MPEIEISEDQRAYLEDLRAELAAEHVGAYGSVRYRDAVQFLIDHREGDVPEPAAGDDEPGEGVDESNGDSTEADEGGATGNGDGETSGEDADDGPGRLQAMMQLLDDHEDKWEEVDSEQGKYAVALPDGETETVRTKDDVRGLLFKHYR